MNRQIHELINMKARKMELEVELGTSEIDIRHLSYLQLRDIDHDFETGVNPAIMLDMVNRTIELDEAIIHDRH